MRAIWRSVMPAKRPKSRVVLAGLPVSRPMAASVAWATRSLSVVWR